VTESVGYYEFGADQRFINAGNTDQVRAIRKAWDSGRRARAFGMYWAFIYGHVLDLAANDVLVRQATTLVRHEDLCAEPRETIDRLLAHAELDPARFGGLRESYAARLRQPTYYRATLDDAELADINETTSEVASRLGYRGTLSKTA
jgi:hypothetical protein